MSMASGLSIEPQSKVIEDLKYYAKGPWSYEAIYNEKMKRVEHLLMIRIDGTHLDIYKLNTLKIYITPLPVLRQRSNGNPFEIFVMAERDGSLLAKNKQALRLVQLAAKRAKFQFHQELLPNRGNIQLGNVGFIIIRNAEPIKRLMRAVELIINEIELKGHDAVLGKVT